MEEWKEYKLGELCNTISDTYKRGAKEVVLINTSDVLEGKCLNHVRVPNENLKGQFKKTFQYNDILYSEIRPANKRFAFVDFDATDYIASTKLMVLRHNDKITPQYLYYILKSQNVIEELQMLAESRSGTFPQITFSELSNLKVWLPNKKTQNKIISILSSLDDKIEVNRRINEQLEELAQALFKSWFVDFEPFKDGEFVESELGMIPKGWKVTKLDEVSSYISRGLTPKYDNDSDEIILGQTCVRNNIVTLNNGRKHRPKKKNEKWLQQWDVLINSTGVGSLGRVGIVYFNKDNVAIDSHITVVRPISSLYKHYIGRTLLNKQAEIENMAIGSTGQTELPKDSVKSMLILLPIDDILVLFNKSIEPICKLMYSNLEEITQLSNLRDTLLPKLMSGEIEVEQLNVIE